MTEVTLTRGKGQRTNVRNLVIPSIRSEKKKMDLL